MITFQKAVKEQVKLRHNPGWDREERMKHTRESIVAIICECRKNGTDIVLQGADLSGLDLRGLDLRYADLRWSDLQETNLQGANLQKANLRRANLQEVNLRYADLQEANLLWADLRRANLQEANLQKANLRRANLQGANLQYADLQGANLQYADLQGANLDYAGYELSCETIGIKADKRLVSQLLYHLCRMDVQDCPEWDELRNDERVIALANQSHVVDVYGLPEIEPQAQEEK